MQRKTWKGLVCPRCSRMLIDLRKLCWRTGFKQRGVLRRQDFVSPRCFWTCPLTLHHRMDDWWFTLESSEVPVKLLRSSDKGTMITRLPLALLWIGFRLQYVACQRRVFWQNLYFSRKLSQIFLPVRSKSLISQQSKCQQSTSSLCGLHLCRHGCASPRTKLTSKEYARSLYTFVKFWINQDGG